MSDGKRDLKQIKLVEYRGVIQLHDVQFDNIRDLACRPGDIWVCSFPRSGTTLTQHMVYLIQTLDFEKSSRIPLNDRFPYIDVNSSMGDTPQGRKLVDSLPTDEVRMIKSHLHYFLLPTELKAGKGRIIYTVRNPKSAAPSMFRLMRYLKQDVPDTMREYLENFLDGKGWACPWGLHVRQFWEHRDDENVLFLQYEHTVKDRRGTIRRIANFLNRDLSEDDIDRIFEATSIDIMRDNKGVNFNQFPEKFKTNEGFGRFINTGEIDGWRKDLPEDFVVRFDELLEKEIGEIDGWRKDIPEDLLGRFDEMIEREIGHTDIKFT